MAMEEGLAMSERARDRTYNEDEIKARLERDLPHWYYEDGWIRRHYRTHGWKSTLMAVNAIGHLAEAAWHHPDLSVTYNAVEVRLMSHDAKLITARYFALAKKIEELLQWQPGKEGGPFTGTPQEPRHAYMVYEKERLPLRSREAGNPRAGIIFRSRQR
jgi:4a-hydroxytetrahydrobiopterin dehydratase